MQTVWKGSIAFGLVSIPVRLVSATEEKDITLRQVHEADGGRIKYKRTCSVDGEEVAYGDIAKGYELESGDVVILTDSDFANLPIASTKSVEVLSFADSSEIDPVSLSRAYYADPAGDPKPYVLLHDTLVATNKVAIVKVALRQKERLATIRAQNGVLVVHTMLWPEEVRTPLFGFMSDDVKIRPQELDMAKTYVDAFDQGFDPDQYSDRYRDALHELIDAKVGGHELTKPPEAHSASNVVDLMEALRASVAAADTAKSKHGGRTEPKKAAAKEASAKSQAKTAPTSKTPRSSAKGAGAKKATTKKATTKRAAAKTTKKSSASRRTA